jgi:hypothetical protein
MAKPLDCGSAAAALSPIIIDTLKFKAAAALPQSKASFGRDLMPDCFSSTVLQLAHKL